jgi:hypothetical protein
MALAILIAIKQAIEQRRAARLSQPVAVELPSAVTAQ